MGLTLRIEGSGAVPGRVQSIAMSGAALAVGRAEGNDLVLPDPERVISSRHCVLEARGSDYVLIDISTNGTFLNYAPEPVGEAPAPLSHGDVISIGRYELRVEIQGAGRAARDPLADLPPPLGEEPVAPVSRQRSLPSGTDFLSGLDDPGHQGRDFLDELLGEGPKLGPPGRAPDPLPEPLTADDLLPPDRLGAPLPESSHRGASAPDHSASAQDYFRPAPVAHRLIPDDWDTEPGAEPIAEPAPRPAPERPAEDLALRRPSAAKARPAEPVLRGDPFSEPTTRPQAADRRPPPERPLTRRDEPQRRDEPGPAAPPASADAARAFLKAAGIERLDIPDAELEAIMARLGETFRILVTGLREVLIARASIKNEFRLSQTVIAIDNNNPIKFSINPDQAIEALVRPPSPGYLPAPDAARQALDDIKAHEVAMMSGMQAAIHGLLVRFDPERLASRIETGGLAGLLGNKKSRYWDAFATLYDEIAREAEDDFQTLFGKEFARAYQAQIKKL
ncbi:MAG TPA: type VI secretion system-associated FHA domain protein TagH [Paracoccaceae bacterium]|nr:type VI secretion system-associated FHA domain protein TagH [Paracoccaceae bacterium]